MVMVTTSHIEPFDPKVGNWESYLDCFECYLVANGIEGDNVHCTTLLSTCGQEVFDMARNLVAPSKLLVTPLDEIKTKLKDYFKLKTSAAIHCCAFHQQSQKEGKKTDHIAKVCHLSQGFSAPEEVHRPTRVSRKFRHSSRFPSSPSFIRRQNFNNEGSVLEDSTNCLYIQPGSHSQDYNRHRRSHMPDGDRFWVCTVNLLVEY
ncbi:UNVERIFIED_CONTAM: hypothetical protein K2H54_014315 [Gekko kuhli]